MLFDTKRRESKSISDGTILFFAVTRKMYETRRSRKKGKRVDVRER